MLSISPCYIVHTTLLYIKTREVKGSCRKQLTTARRGLVLQTIATKSKFILKDIHISRDTNH